MAKKDNAKATTAAHDLKELTERAQREPGIAQVLALLEQTQAAEQAIRDMTPGAEHITGGTFNHTF